jgi:TonB-linked SusC/RagA family outer membrane protein
MTKKHLIASILYAMKVTVLPIFLVTFFTFSLYASETEGQAFLNKPVSATVKQCELYKVIDLLQAQTSVRFLYSPEAIQAGRKISFNVTNKKLGGFMEEIFKPLGVNYKIVDNRVLLYAPFLHDEPVNKQIIPLKEASAEPQDKPITGLITNEKAEPLPNVSIVVKGTTIGTVTDQTGNFKLRVPDGRVVLVISYTGYVKKEVAVTGSNKITVQLDIENNALNEVVVVGYGTQKKENLTGAVASIGADKLESRPITNLAAGLQGLIPNLNINRVNGAPGTASTFNIRGNNSTNSASGPLVLVDGVQMDPNLINPDDVETVTVLKDAASAAIYGVRGAFGVILITTKSPKKNAPVRVSYSGSYSTTRPTRMPTYMNSLQYITAHRDADRTGALSGGSTASEKYTVQDSIMAAAYLQNPMTNPSVYVDPAISQSKYRYVGNTDWIDVLYPSWSPLTQHTVSVSGGQGKTSFVASMGYFQQDGLLKVAHDTYQRFNPTVKINTEVNKWLDLNFKVTLNRSESDKPTGANSGGTATGWISTDLRPTMPVYHPDGHYSGQGNFTNPVALATLNGRTREQINDLFLTGGAVLKPIKNMRIVADYTFNSTSDFLQQHWKAYQEYGVNGVLLGTFPWSTPSRLTEGNTNTNYLVLNAYADYEKTFGRKHYFKAMVGYNQEYYHSKFASASVKNLIDQETPAINLNSDPAPQAAGYNRDWALTGTFYRLNYIFNNKYLLEVNGRYDGTSRYQRGLRYTFLPSVSAGWRVSEEKFFEPIKDVVNDFKLRGSYGTLGNQISSLTNFYPYLPTMGSSAVNYIFGSTLGIGVNPPALVNANFTWEKVTTKDIGFDMSMLKNRLTASFDAYVRDTKDILAPGTPLPNVLGTAVPQLNAASLRTKGWEVSINWRDRITKDLSYNFTVNVSDYHAEITRYDQNPLKLFSNNYYVGQKLGEIWGLVSDGYFKTDADAAAAKQSQVWGGTLLAGDVKYQDLNKDGAITYGTSSAVTPGDQRIIGNNTPRYQFGVNLNVDYKGFDFTAFLQGVGKRDYALSGPYFYPFNGSEWDVPVKSELDYWTPNNANSYYPRLRFGGGGNYKTQTKYLQNAAYIRMKNLALGYTLPLKLISKVKLSRARIYISGENLFEFTNLNRNYDPELLGAQDYPLNRAVSFGLRLGL